MQTEIEAKFYVPQLNNLRTKIIQQGGQLKVSRQLERNWRFDTLDAQLASSRSVLRLRQDTRGRLTYKQPLDTPEIRSEIEFEVTDLNSARTFLEALGYRVIAGYEKYREVFLMAQAEIMLDELPFGHFVEIEADALDRVRTVSERLGLRWENRVQLNYLELFDQLRRKHDLAFTEASFENFSDLGPFNERDLGVAQAGVS